MILYLDASALVKQYVRKAGSEEVASAIADADRYLVLASSILAGIEVPANLALARRMGRLSQEQERVALRDFGQDYAGLHLVPVDVVLVEQAAELARRYSLRGYGAVHLASAFSLADMLDEELTLACFDRALSRAARAAGLLTMPEDLQAWQAGSPQ